MVLLDPAVPNRALYALGCGVLAVGGMLAAARLPFRASQVAATGVLIGTLALALLGGGVADELLRPDRWGELASGIGRGLQALPGVRVPYRGVDEWSRTVIPVGGTVLVTVAGAVAFWPRRSGIGFPAVALGLLVALYAIPAVALDFENEFLRGAALALLVLAFMRLEKLRVGDAGTAAIVAVGVAVLALMVAPALDKDQPWFDYENWALDAASAKSTSFSWDHDYGPLDWPRDGRELLRVRAEKRPAYWKAENLDGFDGARWHEVDADFDTASTPDVEDMLITNTQRIRVTIRNLSSTQFITAGYADTVDSPTIRESPRGDGTWTASRPLRRGDAYTAIVYSPQTNESQRRDAGEEGARADLARFRRLSLGPSGVDIGQPGAPLYTFDFPPFGDKFTPLAARLEGHTQPVSDPVARRVLRQGPYRRTWALAQRLMSESETQEDYVQAVLSYLREGFTYSETPPRSASTLDGFLFDAKSGYCQQYSGVDGAAAADGRDPRARLDRLHVRLAGLQDARVRRPRPRRPFVGGGLVQGHRLGHVRPDARRRAAAQPAERGRRERRIGREQRAAEPRRRPAVRPRPPLRRHRAEHMVGLVRVAGAGAVVLLGLVAWFVVRRRRRAGTPAAAIALGELERALKRMGRLPAAATTLRRSSDGSPARPPPPATSARCATCATADGPLRRPARSAAACARELARGGGPIARLRAWWALPPRG